MENFKVRGIDVKCRICEIKSLLLELSIYNIDCHNKIFHVFCSWTKGDEAELLSSLLDIRQSDWQCTEDDHDTEDGLNWVTALISYRFGLADRFLEVSECALEKSLSSSVFSASSSYLNSNRPTAKEEITVQLCAFRTFSVEEFNFIHEV